MKTLHFILWVNLTRGLSSYPLNSCTYCKQAHGRPVYLNKISKSRQFDRGLVTLQPNTSNKSPIKTQGLNLKLSEGGKKQAWSSVPLRSLTQVAVITVTSQMMQAHQSNYSWLMYILQSQIVDKAPPPVVFQWLHSLTSVQVNGIDITAHDLLQCFNKRPSVSDGMSWGEDLTRVIPCSDKFDSSIVEYTFSKDFPLHNSSKTKQPRVLRLTDTELWDKCCPVLHLPQIHYLSFIK